MARCVSLGTERILEALEVLEGLDRADVVGDVSESQLHVAELGQAFGLQELAEFLPERAVNDPERRLAVLEEKRHVHRFERRNDLGQVAGPEPGQEDRPGEDLVDVLLRTPELHGREDVDRDLAVGAGLHLLRELIHHRGAGVIDREVPRDAQLLGGLGLPDAEGERCGCKRPGEPVSCVHVLSSIVTAASIVPFDAAVRPRCSKTRNERAVPAGLPLHPIRVPDESRDGAGRGLEKLALDRPDGHHASGRARRESLVGTEQRIGAHGTALDAHPELRCKLDHDFAGDPGKHVSPRRMQDAAGDTEQIEAWALGQRSGRIAQHHARRAALIRLEQSELEIDPVIVLDLGRHRRGGILGRRLIASSSRPAPSEGATRT